MRADIKTVYSITTLPDDCVGCIVKNITDSDDRKTPDLLSMSALSRVSKSMHEQMKHWMNPQDHACRLIDQAHDYPYPDVRTMNLVARFAAFFPHHCLEKEIRISCALSTSKLVNELLMITRAGEKMPSSAQQAIALHLKETGILAGVEEAACTKAQYQLGINTVAEILAICGIQIYEFERSEKKDFLAASLLDDGLKALSLLTKSLRTFGFLRVAKSLKNHYSAPIAQQFLNHSIWFIPTEWDSDFMASVHGTGCMNGLSIFLRLPMPDSHTIEKAVISLLGSYVAKHARSNPHWKNLPRNVFDLSLSLYRSLRLKNQAETLLKELSALGIFTEDELLIMDAIEWGSITKKTQARSQFLRLMQGV